MSTPMPKPNLSLSSTLSLHAHAIALGRRILGNDFFQSEEAAMRAFWRARRDEVAKEIMTLKGVDADIYEDLVKALRAAVEAARGGQLVDDAVKVSNGEDDDGD